MLEIFIRRPILSGVISVVIIFLGLLTISSLPITQLPDTMSPSIIVTARYTGANTGVIAKMVTTPLERAINGVPGMTYMTFVCTNDSISSTTIYFKIGTDPGVASMNMQSRVTAALDKLPEEIIRTGVITEKEVSSILIYLSIMSSNSTHTGKSVHGSADIDILCELRRIGGAGLVEIMGSCDYAMCVWLNPDRLAACNMSPQGVTETIRSQNIETAPGRTDISSDRIPQQLQYVLQYSNEPNTSGEYSEIALKALPGGSMLRLRGVTTIELDSRDHNMISVTDGRPSTSIMIKQRPGSNVREVIQQIKVKMEKLKGTTFALGMEYNTSYDISRFSDASISVMLKTLPEVFVLIFIMVHLFLQNFWSTLIPAVVVSISLIGTFFFMQILSSSINILALFTLMLVISIMVNNVIAAAGAVHMKVRSKRPSPLKATRKMIGKIGKAIIVITLVVSAVFIPVGFMGGAVDAFYRQFSLTLTAAIVISGVNTLTLPPIFCILLLKPVSHLKETKKGLLTRFFESFDRRYDFLEHHYRLNLRWSLNRRMLAYATSILFCLATWSMTFVLPSGSTPNEN